LLAKVIPKQDLLENSTHTGQETNDPLFVF